MPVCAKQIRVTVIIIVKEASRPTKVRHRRFTYTGRVGNVTEKALSIVVKEDVVVTRKGGDEDIHPTVMVVVTHCNAHAGHLFSIGGESDARSDAHFLKGSIALV